MSALTVVVLAAGKGTRMRSALPKVLHPLCGQSLLAWTLDTALALDPERVVLVTAADGEGIFEAAKAHVAGRLELVRAIQDPPRGTGHAAQVAVEALPETAQGTLVVLYADMPLVRPASLKALLAAQEAAGGMALLTAELEDPTGYGRILRDEDGAVTGIVEERDCDEEQRWIVETNPGLYAFDLSGLRAALPRLTDDNAQGELYLTDVVGLFAEDGLGVADVALEDVDEASGVNSLQQLAEARWILQGRILEDHLGRGVRIEDPATTVVDAGVEIGADTILHPFCVLRSGVRIGAGCEVGPFAHLRTGAVLEDGAVFGNFCEIKNSTIGPGSKVKHLSYLGDVTIGTRSNVGAGTVFANYDGARKHKSVVGDGAFVGSGSLIVAPNTIPDGATTAAGAVVTSSADIQPGETWAGVPARRLRGAPEPSSPPDQ